MDYSLIIPSFVAGVLTFLAPCTLPLVPGYLAFISGVSLTNTAVSQNERKKIFINGLFYVLGFSLVFILLGSLFGLGGAALIGYKLWLSRIGGLFIIFFGLFMIGFFKLPFLDVERRIANMSALKPGNPASSLIFGATFAFGWTPCVGPILGAVLTLAASSSTVGQGAFLLAIFSLGLAIPFLLIAATISSALYYVDRIGRYLKTVSIIGGAFLIFIGVLLFTDSLGLWIGYFFSIFDFVNYEGILKFL